MIAKKIKELRKNAGYSQQQMATLLNMSQQGYAHYESGTNEPNVETLKKLCLIFNCTSDELLEIDTPGERAKVNINNSFNNSNNVKVNIKK